MTFSSDLSISSVEHANTAWHGIWYLWAVNLGVKLYVSSLWLVNYCVGNLLYFYVHLFLIILAFEHFFSSKIP